MPNTLPSITSGPSNKPEVALTFDDGPNPVTRDILNLLREHAIKATFFSIGSNVNAARDITKRVHDEGHLVANHTTSHPSLPSKSDYEISDELSRCNTAIQQAVGYKPRYYRPPYGEVNDRVNNVAASLGLQCVLWSIDTNDWNYPQYDAAAIANTLRNQTTNGSIILCHDLPGKATIEGLRQALPTLKQRGFRFVRLDTLMGTEGVQPPVTPPVNPPVNPPVGQSQTYVVRSGDDLRSIAQRFYGKNDEATWRKIYEANRDVISDPNFLQVGWVLRIPGSTTTEVKPPAGQTRTHTVQSGDELRFIAQRYYGSSDEASWRRIYDANRDVISNPGALQVGWVLRIP